MPTIVVAHPFGWTWPSRGRRCCLSSCCHQLQYCMNNVDAPVFPYWTSVRSRTTLGYLFFTRVAIMYNYRTRAMHTLYYDTMFSLSYFSSSFQLKISIALFVYFFVFLTTHMRFVGVADISQLNTRNNQKPHNLKRSLPTVSRSFYPPQFLPTEFHKASST